MSRRHLPAGNTNDVQNLSRNAQKNGICGATSLDIKDQQLSHDIGCFAQAASPTSGVFLLQTAEALQSGRECSILLCCASDPRFIRTCPAYLLCCFVTSPGMPPKSSKVSPNTGLGGGVAGTFHDVPFSLCSCMSNCDAAITFVLRVS